MYQIISMDGQVYGPVDVPTLKEWAANRRLTPQMTAIDPITGVQLPAGQMFADLDVFPQRVPPMVPSPQPGQIASTYHEGASARALY